VEHSIAFTQLNGVDNSEKLLGLFLSLTLIATSRCCLFQLLRLCLSPTFRNPRRLCVVRIERSLHLIALGISVAVASIKTRVLSVIIVHLNHDGKFVQR